MFRQTHWPNLDLVTVARNAKLMTFSSRVFHPLDWVVDANGHPVDGMDACAFLSFSIIYWILLKIRVLDLGPRCC